MTDAFDYYRKALAAKSDGHGIMPPVHDGHIQCGLYWMSAGRTGGRVPVAIFEASGELQCRLGTRASHRYVNPEQAADRWTMICDNPVSREVYTVAWETGTWPDGTGTAAPEDKTNLPADPFERLAAEVADKMEQAEAFLAKLGSGPLAKVDADKARNIQAALLAHNKTADSLHKAEKQPHLDAGRAVDDKFRFRDKVKVTADKLRAVFERFMRAEEARQQREAAERFVAECRRIAAEMEELEAQRKKKLADDPVAALTDPEPELPIMPAAPEPVKVNVGGGVGRAAGLRSEWVGTITDYDKALEHFKNHDDVRELIGKLVARAVRAGKSETRIPGVTIKEDRRAI